MNLFAFTSTAEPEQGATMGDFTKTLVIAGASIIGSTILTHLTRTGLNKVMGTNQDLKDYIRKVDENTAATKAEVKDLEAAVGALSMQVDSNFVSERSLNIQSDYALATNDHNLNDNLVRLKNELVKLREILAEAGITKAGDVDIALNDAELFTGDSLNENIHKSLAKVANELTHAVNKDYNIGPNSILATNSNKADLFKPITDKLRSNLELIGSKVVDKTELESFNSEHVKLGVIKESEAKNAVIELQEQVSKLISLVQEVIALGFLETSAAENLVEDVIGEATEIVPSPELEEVPSTNSEPVKMITAQSLAELDPSKGAEVGQHIWKVLTSKRTEPQIEASIKKILRPVPADNYQNIRLYLMNRFLDEGKARNHIQNFEYIRNILNTKIFFPEEAE
jgi:hypothetical protein